MYRKSLDTRIKKLERVENVVDCREVAEHLRNNKPVKNINKQMANKLQSFFYECLAANAIPVPFDGDEPYVQIAQIEQYEQ